MEDLTVDTPVVLLTLLERHACTVSDKIESASSSGTPFLNFFLTLDACFLPHNEKLMIFVVGHSIAQASFYSREQHRANVPLRLGMAIPPCRPQIARSLSPGVGSDEGHMVNTAVEQKRCPIGYVVTGVSGSGKR